MTKEQREALAFCLNAIDFVDIRYDELEQLHDEQQE